MAKSKIYNLDDSGGRVPTEREPLTFADLDVGDVFRFAIWDRNHPDEVSAIKWKVSDKVYVRLTTATVTATGLETATAMAMALEPVAEVVRYDLGLKLSNPQRYRGDQHGQRDG
jgi:hypothetical protein